MTWDIPALPCCKPSAYDGSSTTLVHAYYCSKTPGDTLSAAEWASIRRAIERPEVPEGEARAAAIARHPVSWRRRKARLLYCSCSSPVLPCAVHVDNEEWFE